MEVSALPQPADYDDTDLVQQVLAGDETAFEDLVRRHQGLVFSIVGGFLRSPQEVEEVAQETFLRAFRGLSSFRLDGRLAPWIARIATTTTLDRLRRRHVTELGWDDLSERERRAAEDLAAGETREDDAVAARDLAERALDRLKPKDRVLVVLVDGHGFAPVEAARMVGTTALAVRVRLHRARRALRHELETLLAVGWSRKEGES